MNADKLFNSNRMQGGASALSERNEDSYSHPGMRHRTNEREPLHLSKQAFSPYKPKNNHMNSGTGNQNN